MTRKRIVLLSAVFLALLLPAAAVNAQDLNEEFWVAARKGDAAAVKALLAKGVDVNAKFRYGATALSYAADRGHVEVVKILLEHGADVNVKDTFYKSAPIIWAALKGHAQIVRLLLDKGAEGMDDVLTIGAGEGYLEVVKTVLDKGGVRAEALSSALGIAQKNNRTEIAEMLKKAGALPPPKADLQVDAETLKSYTGTYKSQEGREFIVALKDGKLTAAPAEQSPIVLGAIDKTTFKPLEFEGVILTFSLEGAKVTGLTIKQGTNNMIFKKVEAK